jgi:hypothetical protein
MIIKYNIVSKTMAMEGQISSSQQHLKKLETNTESHVHVFH